MTNTTPQPMPAMPKVAALDVLAVSAEAGAAIAGARALIAPHRKTHEDLEAAALLMLSAACMLTGLVDDVKEGLEA